MHELDMLGLQIKGRKPRNEVSEQRGIKVRKEKKDYFATIANS